MPLVSDDEAVWIIVCLPRDAAIIFLVWYCIVIFDQSTLVSANPMISTWADFNTIIVSLRSSEFSNDWTPLMLMKNSLVSVSSGLMWMLSAHDWLSSWCVTWANLCCRCDFVVFCCGVVCVCLCPASVCDMG